MIFIAVKSVNLFAIDGQSCSNVSYIEHIFMIRLIHASIKPFVVIFLLFFVFDHISYLEVDILPHL